MIWMVLRDLRNLRDWLKYVLRFVNGRLPDGMCHDVDCGGAWDDHILFGDDFVDEEEWAEGEGEDEPESPADAAARLRAPDCTCGTPGRICPLHIDGDGGRS